LRKWPATGAQVLHPQDADIILEGNGQDIIGAQDMARFCDFCPVQANVPCFNQFSGHGAVLDHPGKPEPFV
jgi:hypothetical protein